MSVPERIFTCTEVGSLALVAAKIFTGISNPICKCTSRNWRARRLKPAAGQLCLLCPLTPLQLAFLEAGEQLWVVKGLG